uniref:NADH-ubiquinone oxidoreductase chain 2 n=1 Tax=Encarsia obtusiclava TaxID=2358487 RepID=A0A386T9Y8_9HYME|nr:NADH dehydrogenase subunit 2 [Encarsia obtusiclava]
MYKIIFLNYYCYMLFMPMILITTMLIFIANSWFSMWMIMEINLISFICLMVFDKNLKNELTMNYFLIQSFNSYLFLTSFILMNSKLNIIMILIMYMSILSKIGLPPFYIWYLKLMKNMNWMNLYFMSTIQKLIPLIILNNIMMNKLMNFMIIYLILISFFSSIKGLNQNNLKIILTYSSIIQISWMLMLMMNSELMMLNYFLIYSFINLNLSLMFNKFNIETLNNLMNLKMNNKNNFFLIMLMIFSLSSMPPMFGFLMKLISIQNMFLMMNFFLILMMIFNSLISMYFYLKIMFISMLNFSIINKINLKTLNFKNKYNFKFLIFNMMLMLMMMSYELI